MKAYWEYWCDEGHHWLIVKDIQGTECPCDDVCPYGHPAVMLTKEPLLDMVQIAVRPAARVADANKGQITHLYEYYLVITDLHNEVERMSKRTWTWTEVVARASMFRVRADMPGTKSPTEAWKLLDLLDAEKDV
jgi:hypothetical protein